MVFSEGWLTSTFVKRRSNSPGSGIACFSFALMVLCRILACLPCSLDPEIVDSGSSVPLSSDCLAKDSPIVNSLQKNINTRQFAKELHHEKHPKLYRLFPQEVRLIYCWMGRITRAQNNIPNFKGFYQWLRKIDRQSSSIDKYELYQTWHHR